MKRAADIIHQSDQNYEEAKRIKEQQESDDMKVKQTIVEEALDKIFANEKLMLPVFVNLDDLDWKQWPENHTVNVKEVIKVVQKVLQEKCNDEKGELGVRVGWPYGTVHCDGHGSRTLHKGSVEIHVAKRTVG